MYDGMWGSNNGFRSKLQQRPGKGCQRQGYKNNHSDVAQHGVHFVLRKTRLLHFCVHLQHRREQLEHVGSALTKSHLPSTDPTKTTDKVVVSRGENNGAMEEGSRYAPQSSP